MSKNLLLLFYFKKITTLGRKITILLFFYFLSSFSIAQQTINGDVTHDNVPLSGVSVKIKGTLRGTTTGIDGNFSIKADRRETLVFSSVGYEEQEIEITNGSDLHVQMISTASTLGEVVVVGFGTQKKMNLTGSVSTVSSTELETKNVALGGIVPKELLDNGFLVVYRTSDELIRNLREIRFNNDHGLFRIKY